MEKTRSQIETQLIHAGEPSPLIEGAVSMPIFQSSTYAYRGETDYHALRYIRLSNTPNHVALHTKLAAIENAESALVTASGMAAVSTTLLTLLAAGDHMIAQDCLYGGTHDLLTTEFPRLGITHTFVDGDSPESWAAAIRPTTKAIYVESISNPLVRVADLKAAITFARANGLVSIIDNTFASPINFRPIPFGFDLVIHSCTKYLNGHSDIVAGAVIGRAALIDRVNRTLGHLGGSLDPHSCFLLHRGMKTLAVRVRYQNESAAKIALFLSRHGKVSAVNYPGLEGHPDHARARQLFDGFGGTLSFELKGGVKAAERFIGEVKLPISAPSLGGVESLITRPATTSHSGMSAAARESAGIREGLIRLSVGLEGVDDLIEDLDRALAVC
ncbi:MAG TPA: aminotransferase class I/II-fold pyridoxal phosphate-dependent enzyme [Candidatus Binataceae bacterium]|nr:aminotransferase class I/II-fold pyridoxal phosphate-dependent enzyme [Candidatus Binataceae bacterium]